MLAVEDCLRRVAERSPELKSGIYMTEAAERRAKQAARRINPHLQAEIEGVDAAEITVTVSQEFELAAKRWHRAVVAEAETAVIRAEQEARMRTTLFETRRAALAVQIAQEKARLADEALALIRETESVAEAREKAGKATVLETERARADTIIAEIELETCKAEQRDAVRNLALLWGETEPTFDAVSDPLNTETAELQPLNALLVKAASTPELLIAEAQRRACEARIGAARAARVPNVELSTGVRRFDEGGDFGFVAGVGIELPFYTRNRDGVRAAEADAVVARLETVATRLKREGRIRQLYARLDMLASKIARLKGEGIPVTERILSLVQDAHKQGKADYLDVLESRRSLVETRLRFIETVTEYVGLRIDLEQLSGADSTFL